MDAREAPDQGCEGIRLRSRIVPRLPSGVVPEGKKTRGRPLVSELDNSGSNQRGESEFATPRGERQRTMDQLPSRITGGGGFARTPSKGPTPDPPAPTLSGITRSASVTPILPRGGTGPTTGGFVNTDTPQRVIPTVVHLDPMGQRARGDGTGLNAQPTGLARRSVLTAPEKFDGSKPRQWLLQVNHYYDAMGMTEEEKLMDVPGFLIGEALDYWCSIVEYAPEQTPEDWEGFRQLMLSRFSGDTVGSTIAKLKQIWYTGDFEEVARKFAKVLAEGEHPPHHVTKTLFLSRFPYKMVKRALEADLVTWVQAREYLRQEKGEQQSRALEWYEYAPPHYRREVEREEQIAREGWLGPVTLAREQPRPALYTYDRRGRFGGQERRAIDPEGRWRHARDNIGRSQPQGSWQQQNSRQTGGNENRCYHCNGSGHLARNCPNVRLDSRRNGQRCHRCGGVGHWASACPTPPPSNRGPITGAVKVEKNSSGQQGNGQA